LEIPVHFIAQNIFSYLLPGKNAVAAHHEVRTKDSLARTCHAKNLGRGEFTERKKGIKCVEKSFDFQPVGEVWRNGNAENWRIVCFFVSKLERKRGNRCNSLTTVLMVDEGWCAYVFIGSSIEIVFGLVFFCSWT